ncbi:MAG: hypothetical protein ABIJ57_09445 [Pseudomonadota bacterium]|uniref:Capsid assembly protein n=1 Tax=viral metagenome TaxID=1070528 RepID=A0A6M3KPU5_9ZZZZ
MPEPTEGANMTSATLGTPATADALTPPVNDGFGRIDPTVDSVSDVDGAPVKVEETKPVEAKPAEAKPGERAEKDPDRFDKHPRFQELLKERDSFKLELENIKGQLKVLTPQQKETVQAREEKELPYKDITKLTKEQVLEWQEDDPVGYAANLYQQMLHEARETLNREKATESYKTTVKGTYERYAKNNPDFMQLWNSGDIQKVMDSNPILFPNAISAHMAMKLHMSKDMGEKATKEAVNKAVKEAEERVTKNFQAKRNAAVIGDGGAVKVDGIPDELKNPDKYGGTTAVGAMRLQRLRQQAAGG